MDATGTKDGFLRVWPQAFDTMGRLACFGGHLLPDLQLLGMQASSWLASGDRAKQVKSQFSWRETGGTQLNLVLGQAAQAAQAQATTQSWPTGSQCRPKRSKASLAALCSN